MTEKILMHVGPSISNYYVHSAASKTNVGFASKEFVEAMGDSLHGFMELVGAGSDYFPFILPGGGTSAMEAAVSFLHKDSSVLIVSNGVFGDRWEGILSRYPVNFKVLRAKAGRSVDISQIETELSNARYDAVTFTQVETSTGVRMPLKEIVPRIRNLVDLVIIDGVAGVGGEPIDVEKLKIDILLTASQKAIGAQAGAGLMVASSRAMEKLAVESISGYYLDLRNWKDNMKGFLEYKGSYFATPPVGTVLSLQKAFKLIQEEGKEKRFDRHRICADAFRKGIAAMGLELVSEEPFRSNTVSGVMVTPGSSQKVVSEAMNMGVEFASGVHPEIKDRYFRVGHMGWIQPSHIVLALKTIETACEKSGIPVNRGEAEVVARDIFSNL
ncbi:MAG TPA: alanine--glyoxylate aminotransferase family protein [Thermoplasmataceae archaeon]|nr:alanine--glyoxylate aminotransferase family protein [Thermoplasmataceae archaeon]